MLTISSEKRQRNIRLAVAIANSEYRTLPRLECPSNDVRALKKTLGSLGFNVHTGYNLERTEILELLSSVSKEWQEQASEIVFYYSGRGASLGNYAA